MKKQILVIILLAVLVVSCLALTACHTCEFGEWEVTKQPTCTQDGSKERYCTCGKKQSLSIATTGHTPSEWIIDIDSTCTAAGSKHQTCEKCFSTINVEPIAAKGHTFDDWSIIKQPTCTEEGLKERFCSCGEKQTTTVVNTGHTFDDWIVITSSTCTKQGLEEGTCHCGEKTTRNLAMLAHAYTPIVVSSTCTEQGSITYRCTCGDSYVVYTEPTGHKDSNEDGYCDSENCEYIYQWVEDIVIAQQSLYELYAQGSVITKENYEVVTISAVEGRRYNISWSIVVVQGDENAVEVGEINNYKQVIKVNGRPSSHIKYLLIGTFVNEEGKPYKISGEDVAVVFEYEITPFIINTYEEYLEACIANDGRQIRIQGYVIGVVCMESGSKGSLYIQDADGHGYYAYAPAGATDGCETTDQLRAKWPIGTEVLVTGTVTTYNGQYEFNKNCEIEVTGQKVTDAQLPYVDATSAFAAATSNEDTALAEYQNRRVELKGAIITRVDITLNADGSYNKVYYYFKLPGSEVEFNVYYTIYLVDETTMLALHELLKVGSAVDIRGIVSVYSKDFQIYPDSAYSVTSTGTSMHE